MLTLPIRAPRHRPSVFDVRPDDLSTAGSCATALARRHRTDSLGRVEVTDRHDMPLGCRDPRAEAQRAEAVPGPSAAGVVHEAAAQRDAVSRAAARDKPGDVGGHPRDKDRREGGRGRRRPSRGRDPARRRRVRAPMMLRHEPMLSATTGYQMTASSPRGTFSQAEITAELVTHRIPV